MKATNITRNEIIAHDLECAETMLRRMIGLLGRASMEKGSGLLIRPCKGIHTFGMKFSIDALFVNDNYRAVAVLHCIPPNRITRVFFKASAVIELPAGSLQKCSTQIGDHVEIV